MRKWTSFLKKSSIAVLSICMMMGTAITVNADGNGEPLHFTKDGFVVDSEGMITSYTGTETQVIIPSVINGVTVKGLAGTFQGNETVQVVMLPEGITSFRDNTFNGCKSLSKVCVYDPSAGKTLDEVNQEKIDEEKKRQEEQNNQQNIPAQQEEATNPEDGDAATGSEDASNNTEQNDANSGQTGENAGNTPTEQPEEKPVIPWFSFADYIQDDAGLYYDIVDMGSCVVIPKSLTGIGAQVFNDCTFASFEVLDGNTSFCDSNEGGMNMKPGVGGSLMSADKKVLYRIAPYFRDLFNSLEYDIPEGVEEIAPYAAHKLGLQKVQVSDTVTTIDAYAFYESQLLGVTFEEVSKVATIGEYAFAYNANLDIILPPSVTTIGTRCLAFITNRTPDISETKITSIPAYTFEGCTNLHTITMPETLLNVEAYAFAGNDNLNEVVFLGERLDKIGTGAFKDCPNMHKIDVPEGVTAIENDTFSGCTNLNEIILPDSLNIIGDNAFADCQNIHEMVIPPNVTYISNSSFNGANQDNIDTSQNAYASTMIKGSLPEVNSTKVIGNIVYKITKAAEVNGEVTVVGAIDKKQKTIVIADKVNINGYDFNVTSIDAKAFAKNTKLTSVTIGKNVTTIGKEAFKGCKKLKKITVKGTAVKKVNKNAFKGIHKKATIKLPKMKKKQFATYKKKFAKKGQAKSVKIKK